MYKYSLTQELKSRVNISDLWVALGGGPLTRAGRGKAFWRNGNGLHISVDCEKGVWHDFVSGAGGDVVELIRTARQCSFGEAIKWLASYTGVPVDGDRRRDDDRSRDAHREERCDQRNNQKWARLWGRVCELMCEWMLEELPGTDPERAVYTRLLACIRRGEASLLREYLEWRELDPQWTSAMCRAGQRLDARQQRKWARWLRRYANGDVDHR
jgi:hypothetical protein